MPVIEVKKLVTVPLSIANQWCSLPYYNHPRGCPNHPTCMFSVRKRRRAEEVFDTDAPMYLAYASFDLVAHAARMKQLHPEWTERQCRNLRYWQNGVDRRVARLAYRFCKRNDLDHYYALAEGYGINVYATAYLAGLRLEHIRHLRTVRKLLLLLKLKGR